MQQHVCPAKRRSGASSGAMGCRDRKQKCSIKRSQQFSTLHLFGWVHPGSPSLPSRVLPAVPQSTSLSFSSSSEITTLARIPGSSPRPSGAEGLKRATAILQVAGSAPSRTERSPPGHPAAKWVPDPSGWGSQRQRTRRWHNRLCVPLAVKRTGLRHVGPTSHGHPPFLPQLLPEPQGDRRGPASTPWPQPFHLHHRAAT